MALLNLLQLLQSDDQTTFTDKVNYNFDQLLSMGGSPIGPTGFAGIQGVPGNQGVQGFQGLPGLDGARWYVLPSSSTPSIPNPRVNDLWLQTDTLHIFEYVGSPAVWVDLGFTLQSTGVFKSGGTSNLLFTNPSATRSLVLSPIDYGVGNDSPASSYKLKIVGNSSSPMLRFAIDDAGSENSIPAQATLGIQKIVNALYTTTAGINWRTNFDNNGGDFFLNTSGNYFAMYPQISSVGRFDFGSQTRLQNSATSRLLSFAASNTGTEFFNIGRHTGITNVADNLFTIKDNGQVSFNNTLGSAFTIPIGATDFHIDVLNENLAGTTVNWMRLRGKTRATQDTLQFTHNRLWADGTGSPKSAMIRVQHMNDATKFHFAGFTGGSDSTLTPVLRAQFRLGYADDYYMSGDINGRIGIGDTTFIKKYNFSTNIFKSKLNIQGNSTISIQGATAHSGIHLIPQNLINAAVGITAGGIGTNENITFGAIHFQDDSGAIDQGLNLNFSTGVYADGISKLRSTIFRHGDHFWWSKSNPYHFLNIEPGGYNPGGVLNPNDFIHIGSYDWTSSWKSIIFNRGTDSSGFGDGFIGIGGENGFGDDITSGALEQNMWYVAKGAVVYFDGSSISVFNSIFKVVNAGATLTSGTVSRAKPATKLHVPTDGVTFGTRKGGVGFNTFSNVGANSFTVGNTHKASGIRSIILGGAGHTITGNDTTIIGFSGVGITVPDNNKLLLATNTHISTVAPYSPSLPSIYATGSLLEYISAGTSILHLSSSVNTSNPLNPNEVGRISRVLSLESRTSTTELYNVPVSLEFHIKNITGISKPLGLISSTLLTTYPNFIFGESPLENSKISFYINDSGDLYEKAYFNTRGLTLISSILGTTKSSKIGVDANKDSSVPTGHTLFISAGNAAPSTTIAGIGGDLHLNAGIGNFAAGSTIGNVNIGAFPGSPRVHIGSNVVTAVVQANNILRVENDITTGTDIPGWVYYPIGQYATKQRLNTTGDWQSGVSCNTTGTNFQKSHFSYKIIGKTVYMNVNVQLVGSAWGPNSGPWAILMPQLNYKNYNDPDPNTHANMDSIGWGDFGYALRLQPRKYLSSSAGDPWSAYGAATPQWCLIVQRVDGSAGHNAAAVIRGQIILELN